MALAGSRVDLVQALVAGVPIDGPVDVDDFCDIPGETPARMRLEFLDRNDIEMSKRHGPSDMARMWTAVFRACAAHGIPVPDRLRPYARRLGVVLP